MKYENELKIAEDAAAAAARYLMSQTAGTVESAVGKDIKLVNDKKSEAIIIGHLEKTGIPVLSEESGMVGSGGSGDAVWIVDPLDGSANYMKGMRDLTCISIALFEKDEPVLGVINRYERGEVFTGAAGSGAFLNGQSIKTSDVEKVEKAILATGFPIKRSYSEDKLGQFIKSVQSFKKIRMLGAAALMGAYVACGRVDAYTEENIMLWDIAAASAIVKAAGGSVNIEKMGDSQCLCELFANEKLYEEYQSLKQN